MSHSLQPVSLSEEEKIHLEKNELPQASTCDPYVNKDPYVKKPFVEPDQNKTTCSSKSNGEVDLSRLKKKKTSKTKNIPFWAEDPNILLQQPYTLEFFPVESMTFNQKLNAITRTVLVMTSITFVLNKNTRILGVSAFTILAIFLLYYANNQKSNEGFLGAGKFTHDTKVPAIGPHHIRKDMDESRKRAEFDETFQKPDAKNPLANVLLTDYDYNPDKKPAPPSYTEKGYDKILEEAKKMVVDANPGQPKIADKLFGDLGDELDFEQSMRPFYSTANTTIPNDQKGFAEFCYGDMVSCKEGNMFACGRANPHYDLY